VDGTERDADAKEEPAQEEGTPTKATKQPKDKKRKKEAGKEEGAVLCDRCQRPGDKHRKSCERYVVKEKAPRARARKPKAKKEKKEKKEAAEGTRTCPLPPPMVEGQRRASCGVSS